MNKTQKIIILLTSFFCKIPLIFLTLKDNRKQKNNLSIKKRKKEKEEATAEDLNYINQNKSLQLFKNIMQRQHLTFIKNEDNQEECFLFLRTFKLCKFIENLYANELMVFMYTSDNRERYAVDKEKISNIAQRIQSLYR